MSNITNKLNVMHVNTRSIVNTYDDLCNLLIETATTWHIISISETWLSKSIEDNYNLPGYQAFHCSRETGAGGGAALYIANHLCPERILNPTYFFIDDPIFNHSPNHLPQLSVPTATTPHLTLNYPPPSLVMHLHPQHHIC